MNFSDYQNKLFAANPKLQTAERLALSVESFWRELEKAEDAV